MVTRQRKKFRSNVLGYIEDATRLVQLRAYQALTLATPVETGFARAGWSPTVGSPDTSGPSRQVSRTIAIQQAALLFPKRSDAARDLSRGYKLSDGPVFITNTVFYLRHLNAGSSAQAPSSFVQQAIVAAIAATRRDLRPR